MAKGKSDDSTKVRVSERALMQRINRRLRTTNQLLRAARGGDAIRGQPKRGEVGHYYVITFETKGDMEVWAPLSRGKVTARNVDPEALGRKIGVLKTWEVIVKS